LPRIVTNMKKKFKEFIKDQVDERPHLKEKLEKAHEELNKSTSSWEERFDEKFNHFNDLTLNNEQATEEQRGKQICNWDCTHEYELDDVKEFIKEIEHEAHKRGKAEAYAQARDEIVEASKKDIQSFRLEKEKTK